MDLGNLFTEIFWAAIIAQGLRVCSFFFKLLQYERERENSETRHINTTQTFRFVKSMNTNGFVQRPYGVTHKVYIRKVTPMTQFFHEHPSFCKYIQCVFSLSLTLSLFHSLSLSPHLLYPHALQSPPQTHPHFSPP